ncbi:MAG TPA: tetratricopeptide repeat protein [Thermoanaerobaculia bacterium]|nr:tetratricopeptide repeat protein [Thermoanaerobaculia bacterium]
MRGAPLLVLAAASALSLPAQWLHNPRERTAKAIEEWRRSDYAAADRHLEQALELEGETPRALFNAGTGKLGAGTPGAALQPLARAAAAAAKDPAARALQPDALYNLGNAYLAAGYAAAAAESYRAALRLRPDHRPTKHNLELALRELDKQPPPQQQEQQSGGGSEGEKGHRDRQPKPGEGEQGEQQQPRPQQPQPGAQQPSQGQRSQRLPNFNPQRDMSAEQAAFLLEAVENLEREQRRAQAEEQRRRRAQTATEKDW